MVAPPPSWAGLWGQSREPLEPEQLQLLLTEWDVKRHQAALRFGRLPLGTLGVLLSP